MRFWPSKASKSPERIESSTHNQTDSTMDELLEQQVLRAKSGDLFIRDTIIRKYRPFVMRVTSQYFRRFIDPAIDDGFSIALIALNEAIDSFRLEAGRSFLKFSETVIRRRLTDWVRKESRFRDQIPWSAWDADSDDSDGQSSHPVETEESVFRHSLAVEADLRRDEITAYEMELRRFGFGFADLVESAPKHDDTRQSLWLISSYMCNDSAIRERWTTTTRVPLQELAIRAGVSTKMLEKHRKTLIAYAVLTLGDFPYLRGYLNPTAIERGDES